MSKNVLPFSDTDYDKLDRAVFPTVRRRDKYGDVGDVNTITHGPKGSRDELGQAEIIAKETITLDELTGPFLLFDTQSLNGQEAIDSINQFYRNDIDPQEELTLYWNRWVNNE